MKSTGSACSLLLLTMAAVCSGHNATEYFQQARFQHAPSRPQDALVFFTATAPPLICELEKDGDWIGGDRLKAEFVLSAPNTIPYYTCSFEGNGTTHTNLKLIREGLPGVFNSRGEREIVFSHDNIACTAYSQLPDEYFQLRIRYPNVESPVKCRSRSLEERLYIRFPGYPTIICPSYSPNSFKLSRIVGDSMECAFQVYLGLPTHDMHVQQWLYRSVLRELPTRAGGTLSNFACSRHARPLGTAHFQVRLPGGTIYDCSFSDT